MLWTDFPDISLQENLLPGMYTILDQISIEQEGVLHEKDNRKKDYCQNLQVVSWEDHMIRMRGNLNDEFFTVMADVNLRCLWQRVF